MQKSKFTEQQIAFHPEASGRDGLSVEDTCRKAGISIQTYYRWRQKYGGLMPSEMKRLRQLEEENIRFEAPGGEPRRVLRGQTTGSNYPTGLDCTKVKPTSVPATREHISSEFHPLQVGNAGGELSRSSPNSTSKPRLRMRLTSLAATRAGLRRAKWSAPRSW